MEGGCPSAGIARMGLVGCSRGILAAGLLSLALLLKLVLKLVLLKFVVGRLVLKSSVLWLLA